MAENTYNFENYKMQEVFYEFYMAGKTGVIKVYFPLNIVKTVYFSDGNIVFATSNSEKDKLTNILIKNKKITKEQLNIALKQMDKSISLGRNLVNMGLITHKELVWAVKIQVLSIVYSIIMLKEGEYSIMEGFLPEGIIKLPFNTLKILFDSLILFKDKDWISEQISPDTVFVKTNLFDEYKEKILPDSNYKKIYDLIDGEKTVSEIAGMVDIEDFKVYKLFYALKFLKLIEEKVDMPDEIKIESEELYNIQNDDNESIKMVEEMVGEESAESDIEVEFEGTTSEHSIFEEESEISEEEANAEDESMNSFALNESDFIDDKKDSLEDFSDQFEAVGNNRFDETIASDKEKALEDLQKQLENEEVEFLKEDSAINDEGDDFESPSATVKQEISPEFGSFGEDDFVIEEEEIHSKGGGMGLYVSIILILFIAALGFLGYRFYSSSQKEKQANKVPATVKIVKKSEDVTAKDISSLDNAQEADSKGEKELNSQQNNEELDAIQSEQSENIDKSDSVKETNEMTETQENNKDEKASNVVSYEAVPVYEDNASDSQDVSENQASESIKKEKQTQRITASFDPSKYSEFVSNSKNKLITNPESYTIQLELACEPETLDKAISLLPEKDKIFFVPAIYKSKKCYLVCYGIFDTMEEATEAMNSLDKEFFTDNKPLVRQGKKFEKYF